LAYRPYAADLAADPAADPADHAANPAADPADLAADLAADSAADHAADSAADHAADLAADSAADHAADSAADLAADHDAGFGFLPATTLLHNLIAVVIALTPSGSAFFKQSLRTNIMNFGATIARFAPTGIAWINFKGNSAHFSFVNPSKIISSSLANDSGMPSCVS
jgi:hypothetical protein